jgi:type VI secretion system protein ImpA
LTSPATIPLEALLAQVSDGAPAGENLRLDASPASVYFTLKDKRSTARAAEKRAEIDGKSAGLASDWQQILSIAGRALTERSKDFEIAAWLTEALVRVHGFAGLRDGLRLLRGLTEDYWESFWSLEDEEGLETRLAPLAGLNGVGTEGTLTQPLRKVPVALSSEGGAFAAYHYDDARALAQIEDPELRARREPLVEVTMERFMAAVNSSGGAFYVELLGDMREALVELDQLSEVLQKRAGADAPSLSDIRAVLSSVCDTVEYFSKEVVARMRERNVPSTSGGGAATGGSESKSSGGTGSREEALRLLLQVADYFRQHEPHSPIATSLDEMVRRARMPFPELLAELLPDPVAWRAALTSAGIKPPAESG